MYKDSTPNSEYSNGKEKWKIKKLVGFPCLWKLSNYHIGNNVFCGCQFPFPNLQELVFYWGGGLCIATTLLRFVHSRHWNVECRRCSYITPLRCLVLLLLLKWMVGGSGGSDGSCCVSSLVGYLLGSFAEFSASSSVGSLANPDPD